MPGVSDNAPPADGWWSRCLRRKSCIALNALFPTYKRRLDTRPQSITSEKVVFIPYGGGNNGKTTMLTTISKCLGEYSGVVLDRQHHVASGDRTTPVRTWRTFVAPGSSCTSETEEGQTARGRQTEAPHTRKIRRRHD